MTTISRLMAMDSDGYSVPMSMGWSKNVNEYSLHVIEQV